MVLSHGNFSDQFTAHGCENHGGPKVYFLWSCSDPVRYPSPPVSQGTRCSGNGLIKQENDPNQDTPNVEFNVNWWEDAYPQKVQVITSFAVCVFLFLFCFCFWAGGVGSGEDSSLQLGVVSALKKRRSLTRQPKKFGIGLVSL